MAPKGKSADPKRGKDGTRLSEADRKPFWECEACGYAANFSSRTFCRKCDKSKPPSKRVRAEEQTRGRSSSSRRRGKSGEKGKDKGSYADAAKRGAAAAGKKGGGKPKEGDIQEAAAAAGAKKGAEASDDSAAAKVLKEMLPTLEGEQAASCLEMLRVLEKKEVREAKPPPNHVALRNARAKLDKQRKRQAALDTKEEAAEAALAEVKKEQGELLVQIGVTEAEVAKLEAQAACETAQSAAQGLAGPAKALMEVGTAILPKEYADTHVGQQVTAALAAIGAQLEALQREAAATAARRAQEEAAAKAVEADMGGDDDTMGDVEEANPPRRVAMPRLRISQSVLEADAELRQLAEKADPHVDGTPSAARVPSGWGRVGGGRHCS